MKTTTKVSILLIVLIVAVATIASQFITVRQLTSRPSEGHTTNAGELVQDTLVGQNFVSREDNLSGISVMFATYSGRENTEPIKFHLRSSIDSADDIRVAEVHPDDLGDNQYYKFEFEPIENSKDQPYFFFLVSPGSSQGNAVTVDLDTRDPYHFGTAFLVREQGSAVTSSEILAASGKPTVDVVFETYHTVPLRVAIARESVAFVRTFIADWDSNVSNYKLWGKVALPAFLFVVFLWLLTGRRYAGLVERLGERRLTVIALTLLFIAAAGFRVMYAAQMPLTNDEGNYLYDAQSLLRGVLAGGDGYVKAPLVIVWISIWQFFLGNTLLAGRIASVAISALTILPVYFLARELWGRKHALVSAAIWALFGVAIIFGIYIHTQPVSLFFGVSGLATLAMALSGNTPRLTFFTTKAVPSSPAWFVAAGVLLGLGVASRKSILALGLVPIVLILLQGSSWKLRVRHFVMVGVGFLAVIALFLGVATVLYGCDNPLFLVDSSGGRCMGIQEALGINSAEDGLNAVEESELDDVRAYSLRGMTPFFRESLPLIMLSVIGLGLAFEKAIRAMFGFMQKKPSHNVYRIIDEVIPKIGWVASFVAFFWAWGFFNEYEGSAFHIFGIPLLWSAMLIVLVVVALMRRPDEERLELPEAPEIVQKSTQPNVAATVQQATAPAGGISAKERRHGFYKFLAAALVVPAWIFGLVIFYTSWIKFHANYIAEFIPPLVVLAGLGAPALIERLRASIFLAKDYPVLEVLRRLLVGAVLVVLFWAMFVSNFITYVHEHTGTFALDAIEEAAVWAEGHIPKDVPIFTGAAAVPYVSGHRTALDIAHPRWYAYSFTRNDTERINTFLPPAEEMVQAFRNSEWVLLEKQTGFSFLMEYSEIERGLEEDFESQIGIENGSNTLTFYRRVR